MAAAGWVADIVTDGLPANSHAVINAATVCLTVAAMIVTWTPRGPLHWQDQERYYRMLEAITRGVVAADRSPDADAGGASVADGRRDADGNGRPLTRNRDAA